MNSTADRTTEPSFKEMDRIVKRHMAAAFATRVVPIPFLDMAAMTGAQLSLVSKIADLYGVPFSKNRARIIIGALVAGTVPAYAAPAFAGLLKTIPAAGTVLGMVSMPILSAASAYAIGHLFIEHFESGGTLLTFDAKRAGTRFTDLFKKGREVADRGEKGKTASRAKRRGPTAWGAPHDDVVLKRGPTEI